MEFEEQFFLAELFHQKVIGAVRADNIGDADGQLFLDGVIDLRDELFSVALEIFLLLFGKDLRREGIIKLDATRPQ